MPEIIGPLVEFSLGLISSAGYPGIAAVMALENIFPPIPSEAVMPFAGFLVAQGQFSLLPTIGAGVLGTVLGAVALYAIGAVLSGDRFRQLIGRYGKYILVSEKDLARAEEFFARRGEWAVLIARVIPIIRSIISVPAGFVKMGMGKFLVLTTLGTAAWTTLLTYAGIVLGDNWAQVEPAIKQYEHLVLGALLILGVLYLYHKLRPRPLE